jgi:hypothetical protein
MLYWNGSGWSNFANGMTTGMAGQVPVWQGYNWAAEFPIASNTSTLISVTQGASGITISPTGLPGSNTWGVPNADQQLTANVWNAITQCSVTIAAGTWLIIGTCNLYDTASASSRVEVSISTSSTSQTPPAGLTMDDFVAITAISPQSFPAKVIGFTTVTATTTVYMIAYPLTSTCWTKRNNYSFVTGLMAMRMS